MSLVIWDHTVLPAIRHNCIQPALTVVRDRYSIYLLQREGRLSSPTGYINYTEMFFPGCADVCRVTGALWSNTVVEIAQSA